jgi:hypothetical protein
LVLYFAPWLPSHAAVPSNTLEHLDYSNGLLSLKGSKIAVMDALKSLSHHARVDIFLFDPIRNERINVDLTRKPLEDVLGYLLKGCSYAVLYGSDRSVHGIHIMNPGYVSSDEGPIAQNVLPGEVVSKQRSMEMAQKGPGSGSIPSETGSSRANPSMPGNENGGGNQTSSPGPVVTVRSSGSDGSVLGSSSDENIGQPASSEKPEADFVAHSNEMPSRKERLEKLIKKVHPAFAG